MFLFSNKTFLRLVILSYLLNVPRTCEVESYPRLERAKEGCRYRSPLLFALSLEGGPNVSKMNNVIMSSSQNPPYSNNNPTELAHYSTTTISTTSSNHHSTQQPGLRSPTGSSPSMPNNKLDFHSTTPIAGQTTPTTSIPQTTLITSTISSTNSEQPTNPVTDLPNNTNNNSNKKPTGQPTGPITSSLIGMNMIIYSGFIVYIAFVKLVYHNLDFINNHITEPG